jgi:hypothetical protein
MNVSTGDKTMRPLTSVEIADDAIGLFFEYRDVHGHSEASARANAIREVREAEEARVELNREVEDAAKQDRGYGYSI